MGKVRQKGLILDAYLPYRLSIAANEVSGLIARAYQERFGLSIPQWRLVAVLAEAGPTIQQDLVARTVMDKVTVSRAVQGLIQAGYVCREPNQSDGRSHLLTLSDAGARLYSEVAPTALAFEAALLDSWGAQEVEQLKAQLLRLEATAASLARNGLSPPRK